MAHLLGIADRERESRQGFVRPQPKLRSGGFEPPNNGLWLDFKIRLSFALDHRTVRRSCLPRTRIIDPGIAANYGSRPLRAPEFGVIGKCVMGNRNV